MTNNKKLFFEQSSRNVKSDPINAKKLVVVLKATRLCNLRCTYCHSWAEGPGNSMTFETLVKCLKEILSIPNITRFEFVWHGGEVTMLKPSFFKKLIWLQQKFREPHQVITNSVQSNAVDISEEWLTFLKATGMSVGISIDGVPAVHDLRRITSDGKGSSNSLKLGIEKLRRTGIPYAALVVVDEAVSRTDIREMFQYFDELELRNIDFLNIVPDNRIIATNSLEPGYISYADFIDYLCEAFDIWWDEYKDKVQVSIFCEFIKKAKDNNYGVAHCYWSDNCSQEVITLEANGDITPCDKYVGDYDSNYGSLLDESLSVLLKKSKHNKKSLMEEIDSSENMKSCKWFEICKGGCPHDRMINRRHVSNYNENCCGTGKLIQKIFDKVKCDNNIIQTDKPNV